MIPRPEPLEAVRRALRRSRIVALLGPRQSGKTTLAREIVGVGHRNYFDLEDPRSVVRLEQPLTELARLRGIVVIDEVQRRPDLFPVLRVLADRRPIPARFLLLGSASPELLRRASESLAGRMETVELGGFSLRELGSAQLERHWLRGGMPLAYIAKSAGDSLAWRRAFVKSLLELDVPRLGVTVPSTTLLRFWTMLAHYHGQTWNGAEFARSMGVSEPAVRRYLDLLTGLFMVRQLQPWHENLSKRQVKSPKVYLRDTGLLHALLGIGSMDALLSHPRCGASWEGYAIAETLSLVKAQEPCFWATHQGAELDLFLIVAGRRVGVEVKRDDAPRLTTSMRTALEDLRLDHLTVLYPGDVSYELGDRVTVRPLADLAAGDPRVVLGTARKRGARGKP